MFCVFLDGVIFTGPFTFTYNRGHGECKSPVSNIESCTEESRLLLNLQACPDVAGTESTSSYIDFSSSQTTDVYFVHSPVYYSISFCSYGEIVEELTCLATWKDGNSRYLVGLVSHHHAVSNEERYRCFVYERILSSKFGRFFFGGFSFLFSFFRSSSSFSYFFFFCMTKCACFFNGFFVLTIFFLFIVDESTKDAEFKLAQSGDATCNGLDSAEVFSIRYYSHPYHMSRILDFRRAQWKHRADE